MTGTYDQRCYDLAAAFLADEPALNNDRAKHALAIEIQNLIEDEILFMRAQPDLTDR